MIAPRQNKVLPSYALVIPQPKNMTPPPAEYAQHFNHYQPPHVESSKETTTPKTCNRLLTCIGAVIIGIVLGVAATVPLMIAFYGQKNNGESTLISTTTSASTTSNPTTTNNTVALSMSGVQMQFDPSSLPNGWSLCYNDTYAVFLTPNLLSTIMNTCYKGKLMLGCSPVGSNLLSVAAMGLRNDVFYNCSTTVNCTNVANGVGWYYSDSWSWGFVNNTDIVSRTTCDVGSTNPNHRLSWRTNSSFGGYRCGPYVGLNSATTFQRVIYHAN